MRGPPSPAPAENLLETLSGWMEPRHTLLLRALAEGMTQPPRLPGDAVLLLQSGSQFAALRREVSLRFAEFRGKWSPRLETAALLPLLQRNQWIVAYAQGGVMLAGKGGRKEARLLYLQTLHDMVSDCARQWSGLAGRLHASQEALARAWQARTASGNETRMLPALEATLHHAEYEAWKSVRLSLGHLAETAFVDAVSPWEGRAFARPETLVRDLPAPWRRFDGAANGFMGFMRAVSQLSEAFVSALIDHYDGKWELYLRGFAEST